MRGWKLIEWYTASLAGGFLGSLLAAMLFRMGWLELAGGYWFGIWLPVALLMAGAISLFPEDKPLISYIGFGLLAAGAFAGLVPVVNPSLSRAEWVFAAALVASVSSVLALVFLSLVYETWRGRLWRPVVLVFLAGWALPSGLLLSSLLGQFPGSLVPVGMLLGLLVVLNGLYVQNVMEWGNLSKQTNVSMSRITIALIVLIGVAIVVDVVP